MKIRDSILIVFVLLSLGLAGCNAVNEPTQAVPTEEPTTATPFEPTRPWLDNDYIPGHEGEITGLDVVILESFPVQVQVQVSGYFKDGCVQLVDITAERDGNTFALTLNTRRPAGDVECTQALVPFEEVVPLEVNGLPAGVYTVFAGEMQTGFTLDVDNAMQTEPAACPEPGEGEVVFQAVDREAGIGFCFLIPDSFTQEDSEEERTWILAGSGMEGEGVPPSLTITLQDMEELSFEAWTDAQGERLNLPKGHFDDQITLYQGIALDAADWTTETGARVQWIPVGSYVFQLVFSPLDTKSYPLTTGAMDALYEMVMGSWAVLGD
jgi:inhibitor of cysteine peptidase